MMRNRWLTITGVIVVLSGCSTEPEDTLAVVNGVHIRAPEFRARLRTYLDATGVSDNVVVRKSIIMNMIRENLIVEEAERQGWDRDDEAKRRKDEIRGQAMLDAVARRLAGSVSIDEQELYEEFRKRNTRVSARYVYAPTREDALRLKTRLQRGESFHRLAGEVFDDPGLSRNGGFTGYFGPGEMSREFESAAFTIPVGAISEPVRIPAGFAILRVEDKKAIPLQSESDYARVRSDLIASVRERKTAEALERAAAGHSTSVQPKISKDGLERVYSLWRMRTKGPAAPEEQAKSHPVVTFAGKAWTDQDVLDRLASSSERQRRRIHNAEDFGAVIQGLIAREQLLATAESMNLDNDPQVKEQIANVWKSSVLKRWARMVELEAEPGEAEVRAYFEENSGQGMSLPEIRVKEILVGSVGEAAEIVSRLHNGEDFGVLARERSVRRWSAEQGGDLGFGTRVTFGPLADRLFSAGIGEIVGPERVDPYVGVFMVTDKRDAKRKSFEEAREEIVKAVRTLNTRALMERRLEEMLSNATVRIDDEDLYAVVVDGPQREAER